MLPLGVVFVLLEKWRSKQRASLLSPLLFGEQSARRTWRQHLSTSSRRKTTGQLSVIDSMMHGLRSLGAGLGMHVTRQRVVSFFYVPKNKMISGRISLPQFSGILAS